MSESYDRMAAVRYAAQWALSRNPSYPDFTLLGGDCANFASQCLFAGLSFMNPTPDTGWYYRSLTDRAPAWSGVSFLYEYLLRSASPGPTGIPCLLHEAQPGDLIFLRNDLRVYHVLIVLVSGPDPLVAAHTTDSFMRPVSSYEQARILPVRILSPLTQGKNPGRLS